MEWFKIVKIKSDFIISLVAKLTQKKFKAFNSSEI